MHNEGYRPEIDGLRAIAVTSVILAHADISGFNGGFVGVDVFFVISGYLITNILVNRFSNDVFSFNLFFIQRMRRLLPALMFMILTTLPLFWFVMMPEQFKIYIGSLFSTSILLSNFYFLSQLEYWQADTDLQPLVHMWSLSIEEQYYLLYPFLLLLIYKTNRTWLLPVVLGSSLLGFGWAITGITEDPGKNYFHSLSRFWQLGFGSTLSLLMSRYRPPKSSLATISGLGLIIGSVLFFNEEIRWPSIWSVVPTLGTMFFIGFSDKEMLIGKILSSKPILYIGLISYSMYLWHQPIFAFVRTISLNGLGYLNFGVSIFTLILISSFSYHFIEQPFRLTGNRFVKAKKNTVFLMTSLLLVLVLAGSSLWAYMNIADVNNYRAAKDVSLQKRLKVNIGIAENCFTVETVCQKGTEPKIMVWGDSYAMHLVPAIAKEPVLDDFEQRTMSGCPPFIGYGFVSKTLARNAAIRLSQDCIDFNDETMRRLKASANFEHVIISSAFLYNGTMLDRLGNSIEGKKHILTMQASLSSLIQELNDIGLAVILVSPPPENGKDIGLCTSKLIKYGYKENVCDFWLKDSNYKAFNNFLSGITGRFTLINLHNVICPDDICRVYQDDKIIYRDSGHLSVEGSIIAAKELRDYFISQN